jgi:predicted permease
MNGLLQDIRYAFRATRREPGLTVFAALIIGLGVAANTSVFSVMSPLMLRPLPFQEPGRLVWVANASEGGMSLVTSRTSNLRDFRALNQSFESLTGYFAFFEYESYRLVGDGPPERLVGVGVAHDFLDVLGVTPLLGRNFVDEESGWGGRPAAILTHGFWTRRFGGDPAVVGRSISLNDQPTEVVGVLPPSFDFASTFTPASRVDFLRVFPISDETDQWGNTLSMIGRLRPGATIETAQADLDGIIAGLQEADPGRWGLGATVRGLQDQIAGDYRAAMMLLVAAAAVVMLVACANLSNLLLARGRARSREMAVRSALGAGRRRLVRQLMIESLIMATFGGLVGVGVALGVTGFVADTRAISIPMLNAVSVDTSALLFTLLATLLAGLLVGIVPALQGSHGQEAAVLNDSSRGSTESRRSAAVREGLVVAEVALACVLLVGGGLLLRSFVSVLDVDLGYQPEGAIAWEIETSRDFESLAEAAGFYRGLVAGVAAVPGVEEVGLSDTPPLGRNRSWGVRPQGVTYEPGEQPSAFPRVVDSQYLRVMRIPLLAGRHFTPDDDDDATNVIILNATAAETLFPGEDPIGRTVNDDWQVVGVVGDVRHQSLEEGSGLEMYLPLAQQNFPALTMVVRSRLPAASLVGGVRTALQQADASMPTGDFETLQAVVDRAVSPRRFILVVLGVFGGTALLLAALGIYAVLSYTVSQRIPEIGIRMALGESPEGVRRRVVGRTMMLAGTGVVIGAAMSVVASRLIQSMLFGVGSADALSFFGTAAMLLLVSAMAGFVPALRASSTDPVEALRSA